MRRPTDWPQNRSDTVRSQIIADSARFLFRLIAAALVTPLFFFLTLEFVKPPKWLFLLHFHPRDLRDPEAMLKQFDPPRLGTDILGERPNLPQHGPSSSALAPIHSGTFQHLHFSILLSFRFFYSEYSLLFPSQPLRPGQDCAPCSGRPRVWLDLDRIWNK